MNPFNTSSKLRSALRYCVFGGLKFAEHEELQAFQHRFLITIALCSTAFNAAWVCIFSLIARDSVYAVSVITGCALLVIANFLVWRWLRTTTRHNLLGGWLTVTLFWLNVVGLGYFLPPDPVYHAWLILYVIGCFILVGRAWGWVGTGIAIASSYLLLDKVELALYPNALITMCGTTLASAILSHMYLERLNYFFTRTDSHQKRLQRSSTYDHLTELLNAGAYYAECNVQLATCQYLNQPYTVLFVDLDHFKDINDTHGHATGDHVLQRVAAILRLCLRDSDLVGRVGGEEFSIFMPNTDKERAYTVAERIRAQIEAHDMVFGGQHLKVTASVGLTWIHGNAPQRDQAIHVIQQLADQAMYDAKRAGRNRVSSFVAQV